MAEIVRKCIVCGKYINIQLKGNGEYSGGHYFGELRLPTGEGERKFVEKTKLLDMEVDVVEWTGEHENIEYWECEECFSGD